MTETKGNGRGGVSKYMQARWAPPLAEGKYRLSVDQLERLLQGFNEGLHLVDLAERVGGIPYLQVATTLYYLSMGDGHIWNPERVKRYLNEAGKAKEEIANIGKRFSEAGLEKRVSQLVAGVPDVGYETGEPYFFGEGLKIPILEDVDAEAASRDFGSTIADALKQSPPFIYLVLIRAGYDNDKKPVSVVLSSAAGLAELEGRVTMTFLQMYANTLHHSGSS